MSEVERLSDGIVSIGPGTMYGSIKRMLDEGLIEEIDGHADPDTADQRRRYYRCTERGQAVCEAELQRVSKLLRNAMPVTAIPNLGQHR
jgi:DNA-binding PadR family transcriptional regulator